MHFPKFNLLTLCFLFAARCCFGQCNCTTLEQSNGQIYKKCEPFLMATDSSDKMQLSISKLQTVWMLLCDITVPNPEVKVTGKLTITTTSGKNLYCLLVDHAILYVDNVAVQTNSFITTAENLHIMQTEKIASVQYTLSDGSVHTLIPVNFQNNLDKQMECIQ